MVLAIAIAALLAQAPHHRLAKQPNLPRAAPLAFLEVAPMSGAGMGPPCAGLAITGAIGEAVTHTRASSAYCFKGSQFSGITAGDAMLILTNLPRVSYGPPGQGGELKILAESNAGQNDALRSKTLDNAAWVATDATVAADQLVDPENVLTFESVTDTSAIAKGALTQVVLSTATVRNSFSCYFKGSTETDVTVFMTGASNSVGDCTSSSAISTSTYTRVHCSSAAAYGASPVSLSVGFTLGDNVADQGLLYAGWCQLEFNRPYPSSFMTTVAAVGTRAGDAFAMTLAAGVGGTGSVGAAWIPQHVTTPASPDFGGPTVYFGGNTRVLYGGGAGGNLRSYDGTNNPTLSGAWVTGTQKRYCVRWSTAGGIVMKNVTDSVTASSAFTVATWDTADTTFNFGGGGGFNSTGYLSRLCFSRDPAFECCL